LDLTDKRRERRRRFTKVVNGLVKEDSKVGGIHARAVFGVSDTLFGELIADRTELISTFGSLLALDFLLLIKSDGMLIERTVIV